MISQLALFASALGCLLYALSALMLTGRFFHREGPRESLSRWIAVSAALAHVVALYSSITLTDGQNMSIGNVLSLVAWLMTVAMLVSSIYFRNVILLPVVFGFSIIALLLSGFVPDVYSVNIGLKPGLIVHITLSLFAYGTLIVALLYAVQVNYISGQLKRKDTNLLHSSLPPLTMLDQILIKLLYAGTSLLLVAVFSGTIFLDNMFDTQHIHKTVLTLVALLCFIGALFSHKQWGLRGRPLLVTVAVGVSLLTLAYFGSRIVREIIL